MKSVCAKHEQAFEDSCPWCEPVSVCLGTMTGVAAPAASPAATAAQWGGNRNAQVAAQQNQNAAAGNMMGGLGAWGFRPHDYDAVTYLCRRCGHHFQTSGQPSCPVQP